MTEELEESATGPAAPAALPPGLRADWPAPRVGVYGRRDGFLARVEARLVVGALGALSSLPDGPREACVRALARAARRIQPRRSEHARVFLRQALGELESRELERRVLEAWRHLLRITLDTHAFQRRVPQAAIREHYELELCDDVRRVLTAGRGAILVTPHVGDWEAGSAILPWIGFDPVYVIARPPKNRPLSIYLQDVRERRGLRALPRRGAMQHVPAVVRAGGSVAMLLDQRARQSPVFAPFFGRRARCDRSAGVLLKRLSAPVIFAACYRKAEPFRWKLVMPRVLWPDEGKRLSVEELVVRVNQECERLILAAPEQYFWLHDRYRGGDEGASEAATKEPRAPAT